MTNYRKKPVRIPNKTTKPATIANDETASLVQWLSCYPMMAKNPRAWFARQKFSPIELQQVYEAGWHSVAFQLGYQYRQPLQVLSQPIVVSLPQAVKAAA
jgi:hypothetical protein